MSETVDAAEVPERPRRNWASSALRFLIFYLFAIVLLCGIGWCIWVYVQIEHFAYALYEHSIAPVVLTLGGSAAGDTYSEGQVGRAYLMANGIPEKAIIAETQSRNTEEQARRIVAIARTNNYHRVIIVSDPTHLFRIHEICASEGLQVMTSPRTQVSPVGSTTEWKQVWHEIVTYTLWRMHLH
jgi:uncharacterized SAM-binding protein YcdF (DUF218 family)